MVQVLEKERKLDEGIILEEIYIIEELPMEEEKVKEREEPPREKPVKKALLKLINKAKYNAKYLEDTVPIEKVKNKYHFRSYAVY